MSSLPRLAAAVAALSVPGGCDPGVMTVGAANPAEYTREGEAYAVQCYLVDPKAGGCKALLEKELPAQAAKAAAMVPLLAQSGRVLTGEKDRERGAAWCSFESPGGCTYHEISGDVVVILSRAQGLDPSTARPIADGCKDAASVGTGKTADVAVRLARRADAPADIEIPNPLDRP